MSRRDTQLARESQRPLVSVVVPAYNEAVIVERNLAEICRCMELLGEYRWELILINDGSTDETGDLAEAFAMARDNVHVLHHKANFGLGRALRSGFNVCRGDYVVTLDLDLSYSIDHIGKLLRKLRETNAGIVVASPYMIGGEVSNVPWSRRVLSIWANKLLSFALNGKMETVTSMVRAYDRELLRSLKLSADGFDINPEIIYKVQLLHAKLVELPAHLDWGPNQQERKSRHSCMGLLRSIVSCLVWAFNFRAARGKG